MREEAAGEGEGGRLCIPRCDRPAAARRRWIPISSLLTMDADDTESHFLPPPPGARAVGAWGGGGGRRASGGGRRAPARGEPRSASRAHAPRGPHAGLHSRAHSRPRAAAMPRLLQRRPPQTLPRPLPHRPVTRSRPPGLRSSPPSRAQAGFPTRAAARAGLSGNVGSEDALGLPAAAPPPPPLLLIPLHFRNYESEGKPKPAWPGRGGGWGKE